MNPNSIIKEQNSDIDFDDDVIDIVNLECNDIYQSEQEEQYRIPDIIIKKDKKNWMLSQSLIKKIIDKNHEEKPICFKQLYEVDICHNYQRETSKPQLLGQYFETHCLGGSARSQKVLDLPRKKRGGDKTIDQIRIDKQIELFKQQCNLKNVIIVEDVNTQVKCTKQISDNVFFSGEFDIFPTPFLYNNNLEMAIIDLKLATDVNIEYAYSKTGESFAWGKPEFLDYIQGDSYHYLVRNIDFKLNPHLKELITQPVQKAIDTNMLKMFYWIFGYQKEPLEEQHKIICRNYFEYDGSTLRQRDLQERIRKTIALLDYNKALNFPENPSAINCDKCPLKLNDKCDKMKDGIDL